MIAVETRKNRFEIAVKGTAARFHQRFGKTNDTMIVPWVATTTRVGQTKRRPVPTMVRVRPA